MLKKNNTLQITWSKHQVVHYLTAPYKSYDLYVCEKNTHVRNTFTHIHVFTHFSLELCSRACFDWRSPHTCVKVNDQNKNLVLHLFIRVRNHDAWLFRDFDVVFWRQYRMEFNLLIQWYKIDELTELNKGIEFWSFWFFQILIDESSIEKNCTVECLPK